MVEKVSIIRAVMVGDIALFWYLILFVASIFGGLGVMAVKYALYLGAEVSVFARNELKKEEALRLGVKQLLPIQKLAKSGLILLFLQSLPPMM